ncbi:MAG TPA: DciA family protein [Tepidisphaeraceae bacterium]|nr:DciA family protein [Tepidisphaeraceae bacterium]
MDIDLNQLQRLTKYRSTPAYNPQLLGEEAVEIFNKEIRKRYSKFGKLAEAWNTLVPEMFQEHTFLASFTRGTLCVHVDSSSHLYELRQLLCAGLGDQILLAGRSEGLRKITLKRGKLCD